MDLKLDWLPAILLIAVAAAHIGEETATGFRRFFNTDWFVGTENCPVTRFKGLMIDKIGLFLTLSLFAVLGVTYNWTWIFISIGIIAADVAQHLTFSAVKKSYTPGVATVILYIIYIVYFLSQRQVWTWLGEPLSWVTLAVGAAFIAFNYLYARWKMLRGDCQPTAI